MAHEGNGDINFNWSLRNDPQRLGKGAARLRNQRTSGDHSDYSMVKIGQNTEKSPVDLRRLTISQTPVKEHRLVLA